MTVILKLLIEKLQMITVDFAKIGHGEGDFSNIRIYNILIFLRGAYGCPALVLFTACCYWQNHSNKQC